MHRPKPCILGYLKTQKILWQGVQPPLQIPPVGRRTQLPIPQPLRGLPAVGALKMEDRKLENRKK